MNGTTNLFLGMGNTGIDLQDVSYHDSIYDAANDTIILSGTHFALGSIIVVSVDGGVTFAPILIEEFTVDFPSGMRLYLVNDPDASRYVGVSSHSNTSVPRVMSATHADPLTWTELSTIADLDAGDQTSGIATDGAGIIIVLSYRPDNFGDFLISRSTDNGATWTSFDYDEATAFPISSSGGRNWYPSGIVYNGVNFVAIANGNNNSPSGTKTWAVVSDDAGATWTDYTITQTPPDAATSFVRVASDESGNILVMSADESGQFRSSYSADDGETWTEDLTGGSSTDFSVSHLLWDPTNDRWVTVGTHSGDEEDRIYSATTNGSAWTLAATLEDGFYLFGDIGAATFVYSTSQGIYVVGGADFGLYTVTDDYATVLPAVQA